MFCTKCGTKLPDGTAFCCECGAPLRQPQPAAPQQPAPQPAAPANAPQPNVYQQPVQQPAAPAQPAQPNYQQPVQQPAPAKAPQPNYQQPPQQPAAPVKAPQPNYQQPVQQPAAPAKAPQPNYQQPAQPYGAYQQPSQPYGAYQQPGQPYGAYPQAGQPYNGYGQPGVRRPLLSKSNYMKQLASPAAKQANLWSVILLAVCLVILLAGSFMLMNTSLEDIPVSALVLDAAGMDVQELKTTLLESAMEMEMVAAFYGGTASDSDVRLLQELAETMYECADTLSFNNIRKVLNAWDDFGSSSLGQSMDLDSSLDTLSAYSTFFDVYTVMMPISAVFTLLFSAIGTLCRIRGLVIFGSVTVTINCLTSYGLLIAVLALAAHIGIIILLGKINKEYKAYQTGALAA